MSRRETHRHLVSQAHEVVGIQAEMLFEMIESCIQDWIARSPSAPVESSGIIAATYSQFLRCLKLAFGLYDFCAASA